jgi:hypothetical protein
MPLLLKARMILPVLKQEARSMTGMVLSLRAAQSQKHVMRSCMVFVSALFKNSNSILTKTDYMKTTVIAEWEKRNSTLKFLFRDSHQIYFLLFLFYWTYSWYTEYIIVMHTPCIYYYVYYNQCAIIYHNSVSLYNIYRYMFRHFHITVSHFTFVLC